MKQIFYFYIITVLCMSCKGQNDNEKNNTNSTLITTTLRINKTTPNTWYLNTISEKPILEDTNKTTEEIKNELSNITISILENKISITNYCQDIEYVDLKKKSLNNDFLKRYSNELIKEGIILGDSVNIIRSVIPSEECNYPFNEILKIDDYLIVLYEGYLIYYGQEPLRKTSNKSENDLIVKEGLIKTIKLPFSFYEYFKDEYSDKKYPSYKPTDKLIDFLIDKSYNAENYKCFIIYSNNSLLYLIIEIQRGDSDYYVLLTSKKSNIIDYKEIGSVGNENPITFKILKDLSIEKYKENNEYAKPFEVLKIDDNGKIIIK